MDRREFIAAAGTVAAVATTSQAFVTRFSAPPAYSASRASRTNFMPAASPPRSTIPISSTL